MVNASRTLILVLVHSSLKELLAVQPVLKMEACAMVRSGGAGVMTRWGWLPAWFFTHLSRFMLSRFNYAAYSTGWL